MNGDKLYSQKRLQDLYSFMISLVASAAGGAARLDDHKLRANSKLLEGPEAAAPVEGEEEPQWEPDGELDLMNGTCRYVHERFRDSIHYE